MTLVVLLTMINWFIVKPLNLMRKSWIWKTMKMRITTMGTKIDVVLICKNVTGLSEIEHEFLINYFDSTICVGILERNQGLGYEGRWKFWCTWREFHAFDKPLIAPFQARWGSYGEAWRIVQAFGHYLYSETFYFSLKNLHIEEWEKNGVEEDDSNQDSSRTMGLILVGEQVFRELMKLFYLELKLFGLWNFMRK